MASVFDQNAAKFETHRSLPSGVPEAIRKAVWTLTGAKSSGRVLDLGAGSGRIGATFVEAGDSYVGVDFSLAMLNEFRARNSAAVLVQADGAKLPFPDGAFELVLLMQVLSGTHNWRDLLGEAVRVLVPGGFVVVGYTVTPSGGVDTQMKNQLNQILEEMGVAPHGSKKRREESLEWLRSCSSRRVQTTATSWSAWRTPREFLDRHRSGAWFSTLPPAVQEEALKRLSAWAESTWGSLDHGVAEKQAFELHVFKMNTGDEDLSRPAGPAIPEHRNP